MKQLLLMRHAKSSWKDPSLVDHDRPLNGRGNRNAVAIGGFLVEQDAVPDRIVSSTARRAADTASILAEAMDFRHQITFDRRLYHAAPKDFAHVVAEVDDEAARLMLVSHNPGLEEYLYHLTGQHETMPTAAIAVIDFDEEFWVSVKRNHSGELIHLWRPKEVL